MPFAKGFDSWPGHAIVSDDFRSTSARQAATDGMRSFLFLEERLGRPTLPPLAAPRSVAFVEFVEAAEKAEAFRATLRALGLPRTHRHRSKRVELFRAGELAIVLNLEEEGFPHAFQLLHGLSVAAIALETDGAERARARAEALRATPFVSPVGAGELVIPAVRGVAGSHLFFLDPARPGATFHEIDFLPDPDPGPAPDLGLLRFDHLAQVVPPTELSSWILFYRALPTELRLPIPDNNYADLEARFDLEPERLEAMRTLGILYDRDEEGEFLRLYTRSVNGLFFELVERRRGYARYAEVNAPVRLAAQAELDRSPAEELTLLRGR